MDRTTLLGLAPLVVAMLVVSLWAWLFVPADARFRFRFGGLTV